MIVPFLTKDAYADKFDEVRRNVCNWPYADSILYETPSSPPPFGRIHPFK